MEHKRRVAFTLDQLAQALRWMPRDARILILRLDGHTCRSDHITPGHIGVREDDTLETRPATQGEHYGIVLLPKIR